MTDRKETTPPSPKTNEQRPAEPRGTGNAIANRGTIEGGFSRGHKEETSSTGPKRTPEKPK